MDRRAYKIRNSNFYKFLAKQAVYAISSYAELLKMQNEKKEEEIEATKQFLNGLILESVVSVSFSSIFDGLNTNLFMTDIDKILRVKDKIVAVFEFKYCKNNRIWIKKHSIETLQNLARVLNCKALLISKYGEKWLIKDITNDKVFGDYKSYKIEDFFNYDDKGLLEFLKKLIGDQNEGV